MKSQQLCQKPTAKGERNMDNVKLPEDCEKQWEILLLLIASEEKKIDRTNDNEIDTMNYFLKNEGVKHILLQWIHQMHATHAKKISSSDTAWKSDDISLLWRQRGNDKFKANLLEDCYSCYTKSVLYAPQDGPMYPLALANRSAALLRLRRFEECLADIERSIAAGYPIELSHKLLLRRTDCLIELGRRQEAAEALAAADKVAATLSLTPHQLAELERHVKILERKMEAATVDAPAQADVLPTFSEGPSDQFVNASSVLQLRRSETAGRHVISTADTRRGDVLFSEEPYAWVPLPLPDGGHVCDACCAADINPLPCGACSRAVYCDAACRARAQPYHQYECAGGQADLFPTIGIAHLALRVLLVSVANGFPPLPAGCPPPKTASQLFTGYSNVDDIEIYSSTTHPFYRMFNLVTNFDKMNNMDYIQYALTATMLILYLEELTSFPAQLAAATAAATARALPAAELRMFVAALLLRALGQLVCNGHAALTLTCIDYADGRTVTETEVRRATAIYPSAAMMNHSCEPNVINTFYKMRLLVRGSCDLTAGAQVLNCYGPHRARDTTSRRRQLLRAQYLFTCNCSACLDIETRDFVLVFGAYACQSCKGPVLRGGRRVCPQCRAPFNPQRAADLLDEADVLQAQAERSGRVTERVDKSLAALRLRQQVWYRHNAALRDARDSLARLLADTGDFSKSVELIKQNIQSLEYQFGSFSVEVAHELRKLTDVMLERIIKTPHNPGYRDWCLETHKVARKAVQLMELRYGGWQAAAARLRAQESLVAGLLADAHHHPTTNDVHHLMHYNLKI